MGAHWLGVDQASWVIVPPYPVGWAAGSYMLKPKSLSFGVHSTYADYTGDGGCANGRQGISSSLA